MKKNKINFFIINSLLFFTLIFFGGVSFFFKPKELISENEKRVLSQLPDINIDNIFNGKFEFQFDNYYNDNFIFRNHFINIANSIKENFGIKSTEIRYYNKPRIIKKKIKKSDFLLKDSVQNFNGSKSTEMNSVNPNENNNNFDNSIYSAGINHSNSIDKYFLRFANGLPQEGGISLQTLQNANFSNLNFIDQQAFLGYQAYIFSIFIFVYKI